MSAILLRKVTILAPGSAHHSQTLDILVRDGVIDKISKDLAAPGIDVWESPGACVSPGWMDVGIQSGEPGFEDREDLQSATRAAIAGGFTAVAPFPNTHPVIHSKTEIQYILRQTRGNGVDFFPIGALSQGCEGKDITEMYDMRQAGAIAFSDGNKPVQDSGLLMRSLMYVKAINGLIMNAPLDKAIAGHGQMHEGVVSTTLGLPGIPSLSEEMMVMRDLNLLEYTGSRLHVFNISTAGSVELIREAKRKGLQVTASVAAINLALDDQRLTEFETHYKVMPPLREQSDILALRQGLAEDVIDFICSNHAPYDPESKNLEFPYAKFGVIGMETAFALTRTYLGAEFSLDKLMEKWAYGPRRVLGIPVPEIEAGKNANLTVFHPDQNWTFTEKDIQSKSRNTPFIGTPFKGKVLGIINGPLIFLST